MSIQILKTDKVLSSYGGLISFERLLGGKIAGPLFSHRQLVNKRNLHKFKQMALGFAAGAECLDDLGRLHEDPAFSALSARDYHPKSYGDFLRTFRREDCRNLNTCLTDISFRLREAIRKDCSGGREFVLDLDSTSNQQYGKKTEGVEMNYQGVMCLDTIKAFDELGFQYWHDVRPGSTFSAEGSSQILHHVFSRMPKTRYFKNIRRYARADSAFCNSEFFNACAAKGVSFVTAFRKTPQVFDPIVSRIDHWKPASGEEKKRIKFYDGRECEIGHTLYKPENCHQILRVIVMRAKIENTMTPLFEASAYDYYAFCTNMGEHYKSDEDVILFYRKRGQAENYIKELKHGFDLKHYPCLKLGANRAYGLIAAVTYTLMRFLSLSLKPEKPWYAKNLRHHLFRLPCQVVSHAGGVAFRFMNHHAQEVNHCLKQITLLQLGFA